MKTEMAGLTISYTTVADLNSKMAKALEKVTKELNSMEAQHKILVKQKREISKFLGVGKKRGKSEGQSGSTGSES
jgi:hypothetical protein